MFSRRTGWDLEANAVFGRLEAARASGRLLFDLAESNPTRCGLAWDAQELSLLLADPRLGSYEPTPRGLPEAREAVAGYLRSRGAALSAERVILTASTSEAYAILLKLLCDPGDEVLFPTPCYPLLELLASLEAVELGRYPVAWDAEWSLDRAALAAKVGPRTRAVVAVHPSVPGGAVASVRDLDTLDRFCAERGLEVFADSSRGPVPSAASTRRALTFHLSGLSKVAGLPQIKAAWIAAAGPDELVDRALSRLEVIADSYLSISGPAQLALPRLLARREKFLAPLRERLERNRSALRRAVPPSAPFDSVAGPAGWTAVLRLGETADEERLCLELLEDGVAVQPGFFYDFERNGHLVVSLLAEPHVFDEGLERVLSRLIGLPRPNG
jgi:hypothetical protein